MENDLVKILERARWAPSGDNCQPWTFEVLPDNGIRIHAIHDRENVYEYKDGRPTWYAVGALIENIRLAAAPLGKACQITRIQDFVDGRGSVDLTFETRDVAYDPLEKQIERRTVTRSAYTAKDIDAACVQALEESVGDHFVVRWHAGFAGKMKMVRLNMMATRIRLSIREAFDVHVKIIDWDHDFSVAAIPAKALGMSPMTLMMTRMVMKSWQRMSFFAKYLGGTLTPRLELDLVPGLLCARHFTIHFRERKQDQTIAECLEAGGAIQRFWLAVTAQGLALQPSLAPLIFANYAEEEKPFTKNKKMEAAAEDLLDAVRYATPHPVSSWVFQGRIGFPRHAITTDTPRSIRRPVEFVQTE